MLLNEITGYNAGRKIFDEGSDISSEIDSARGSVALPTFQIAVVVDVFFDPNIITPDVLLEMEAESATPELIKRMPVNSILGRIITRNQDLYDSSPRIFFPVSVFDAEPVKPGEQVFVFFVDQAVNDQIGYWWKRVPQPVDTDDLNFTHADRKYQINASAVSATDKLTGFTPGPPGFVNGGDQAEQYTLSGASAYDDINKNAKANIAIIKEPVARFIKRPGDKIIQGSNASRIVLGMDRSLPAPVPAITPPRPNSATIDMVVGYGRVGTPTAPVPIANSRGEQEVDKTIPKNPIEGDPDMLLDPSRFYLSESTDPDANFLVIVPGVPPTPGPAPSAVIKTDRIRLLASGDIKIVGNTNSVILDQAGNISLIGSFVNLGSAAAALGVARLTDTTSADVEMATWMASVSAALTALAPLFNAPSGTPVVAVGPGAVIPPIPPSDFGIITQASTKVLSD